MTAEFYKGMALGAVAMFWLMAVVIVVVGRKVTREQAPVAGEKWVLRSNKHHSIATILAFNNGLVEYSLGEVFKHNVLPLDTFTYCYARAPLTSEGLKP